MNIVYVKDNLKPDQLSELRSEFRQFEFFSSQDLKDSQLEHLKTRFWDYVEILYDSHLSQDEFDRAHQLRWIHSPTQCVDQIYENEEKDQRRNVLISKTKEANAGQISEYVFTIASSFGKNLFYHFLQQHDKETVLQRPLCNEAWHLKGKTLIQIGLGHTGSMIAKSAQAIGLRVWGVDQRRSFHPYCHKTFSLEGFHSLLPNADIVCIALPPDAPMEGWFKQSKLELMKDDSILIALSPSSIIDPEVLAKVALEKPFRGICLDLSSSTTLPKGSPLKEMPNVLITPGIAAEPLSKEELSFHTFSYNLRQYVYGNYNDMKNLKKFL